MIIIIIFIIFIIITIITIITIINIIIIIIIMIIIMVIIIVIITAINIITFFFSRPLRGIGSLNHLPESAALNPLCYLNSYLAELCVINVRPISGSLQNDPLSTIWQSVFSALSSPRGGLISSIIITTILLPSSLLKFSFASASFSS